MGKALLHLHSQKFPKLITFNGDGNDDDAERRGGEEKRRVRSGANPRFSL